jgi:tryptophanyl-tRNA synthetase
MRILSGIKPSGAIHVANYFGMIRQMVESQSRGDLLCFIANLHSQTSLFDGKAVAANTREAITNLLALGIDPDRSVFWVQSDVVEVCELTWYLNNVTPMGLLQRCHAYKDAVAKGIPANAGLFNYPVLMAADILLYQTNIVPVGQDQKQHVEVTRDIAVKFNTTYGEAFTIPEAQIQEAVAVVPGIDGQKMSKSYDNAIEIFAPEKALKKKVMSIVTDSTPVESPKDPEQCVPFLLYRLVADQAKAEDMAGRLRKGGYGYGEAKKELFGAMWEFFSPYRMKYEELLRNPGYVDEVRAKGAAKARAMAAETIARVRKLVGTATL